MLGLSSDQMSANPQAYPKLDITTDTPPSVDGRNIPKKESESLQPFPNEIMALITKKTFVDLSLPISQQNNHWMIFSLI